MIGDLEHRGRPVSVQTDLDRRAGRRVHQRVRQQVRATWRSRSASPDTTTLSSATSEIGRPGSTARASRTASSAMCAEVDVGQVERTTLVEPREQQHVVDEPAHPRRLVLDPAHRVGLLGLGRDRSRAPQLRIAADRRQRRAQLVRRVRDEATEAILRLLPLVERTLDLPEHRVQRDARAGRPRSSSSAGATRRERSPSAIAFAVMAIFSMGRTPWRSNHQAIMQSVSRTVRDAMTSTDDDLPVRVLGRVQRLSDTRSHRRSALPRSARGSADHRRPHPLSRIGDVGSTSAPSGGSTSLRSGGGSEPTVGPNTRTPSGEATATYTSVKRSSGFALGRTPIGAPGSNAPMKTPSGGCGALELAVDLVDERAPDQARDDDTGDDEHDADHKRGQRRVDAAATRQSCRRA